MQPTIQPTHAAIRELWRSSKVYRLALIAALVLAILRLAAHAAALADPASGEIGADLQTYLKAAASFAQRQPLYPSGWLENINFYQYSPAYALAFLPFARLPLVVTLVIHTLLHLGAYWLMYTTWKRIFAALHLPAAQGALALTLPAWLLFTAFWGDLIYLNIYILTACLASLLIEAILHQRFGWSLLWLSLILQVKPHWAFAAALPLLLGQRRFFLRLLGAAIGVYLGVFALCLLAGGPAYVAGQYADYYRLLGQMSANFPWRGPSQGFIGYNHSVKQVFVFLTGVTPTTLLLADGIKVLLLVPLIILCLRCILRPPNCTALQAPELALELLFALYLGAFIWLDMVWELSLGVVILAYLLSVTRPALNRSVLWAVFIPYVLVDLWQLISYVAFGAEIFIQDAYLASDYSIYLPVILIVLLTFYIALIARLWQRQPQPRNV